MYKSIIAALFFSNVALGAFTNAAAAGNKNGQQFITGKCTSDLDCDSGCCAFKTGLCAGAEFAQEASSGDGGCGFGNAQPNAIAAEADKAGKDPFQAVQAAEGSGGNATAESTGGSSGGSCSSTASTSSSGSSGSSSSSASTGFTNPSAAGNGQGEQFITGKCLSDADCESGCCAFNTGLCAGAVFAQEADSGDGGCGFGNKHPNNNAAQALQGRGHRKSKSKRGTLKGNHE